MKQTLLVVGVLLAVQTAILIAVLYPGRSPSSAVTNELEVDQAPTPPYAYALVHIARHPPYLLNNLKTDQEEFDAYRRTQIARIKTKDVLNRALNDPRVVKLLAGDTELDPISWLEKRISVDFSKSVLR
jgi:hypothetical protein